MVRADLGLTRVYRTARGAARAGRGRGGPGRPRRAPADPGSGGSATAAGRHRLDPESADLIVAIDGKPVKTYEDLLTEVEAHAPGDDVVVTVIRERQARSTSRSPWAGPPDPGPAESSPKIIRAMDGTRIEHG